MQEPSDQELIDQYTAGEERAFELLVDRYERRVYAVTLRMCGDPDDAMDATQDVFISAMRKGPVRCSPASGCQLLTLSNSLPFHGHAAPSLERRRRVAERNPALEPRRFNCTSRTRQ